VIAGWSTICLVCVAPLRTYLAATGHQRFWMWLLVFAVGTVSVLGLYLVPRYSALGASITLAIGEAAMLLLGIIAIRLKTDALHVRDWRPVLRTAAKFSGALAFFIAVLLLLKPYGFIVAGAAGVLVYALALWWMNAFKPGEKASVWLLLSRLAGGRGRSAGPT
jgi:O-antigen/teichoic acid export membrane protein